MALYIPHSIFHLARLLYIRPGTTGPYYVHEPPTTHLRPIFQMQPSLLVLLFVQTSLLPARAPNAHVFPHDILRYIYIYCAGPLAWWWSSCCWPFSWRTSCLAKKIPVWLIKMTPMSCLPQLHQTEPWMMSLLCLCWLIVSTTTYVKHYYCRINCNSIVIQYALALSPEQCEKDGRGTGKF